MQEIENLPVGATSATRRSSPMVFSAAALPQFRTIQVFLSTCRAASDILPPTLEPQADGDVDALDGAEEGRNGRADFRSIKPTALQRRPEW
jgi:hypothetical protein